MQRFRVAARKARNYRRVMDTFADSDKGLESVIVVTTNDLPGYEVVQVLGEVFGLVVRARNAFANIGASLRSLFGGEVTQYTQLLADSRNQAIERLRLAAMERGGNAVLAMRFDCNEIAELMSEIAAYGTAVRVRKK
ncbi:MAG TPA: YbjQ family protein [Candidatus Binataceae bacterium]|nr:YbjQ family protein [Candidatus Binataceae bacterium]